MPHLNGKAHMRIAWLRNVTGDVFGRRITHLARTATVLIAALITALTMTATPASAQTSPQLVELARQYLQERANRLTGPIQSRTSVPTDDALSARLVAEASAIDTRRELLRKVFGGHRQADVQVTEISAAQRGKRINLLVAEHTKLHFTQVAPDAPAFEEYTLQHRFVFEEQDNQWILKDTRPELAVGGLAPDTQPQVAQRPAGRVAPLATPTDRKPSATERPHTSTTAAPDKTAQTSNTTLAWNYTAMLNYANTYWDNYNPNYRSYGGEGGDCTNFISQIMTAGGWPEAGSWPDSRSDNANWFYGDYTWTTSYSWPAAENWYWFAQHHSTRTTHLDNIWDMLTTDVLQVDFDRNDNISHSLFVTDRSSDGELYLTYHSNNTHNKPLSSFVATNPDAWYYAHRT
jgi:hypothetical protein